MQWKKELPALRTLKNAPEQEQPAESVKRRLKNLQKRCWKSRGSGLSPACTLGGRMEGKMYSFESRVRFSETDQDRRLTLGAIVDYFQDCSTFQSEDLGVGIVPLRERNLVWVLSYWQIIIDEYPLLGDEITICTHPHEFRGFMGLRNFYLKNAGGELTVRANSLWTLLDSNTMRPKRIPEDILGLYTLEEKIPMHYASRKVALTGEETGLRPIPVEKRHLDCNGHVNNGQYIHIVGLFLPEEKEVHQLRAEYRAQAHLGDIFYPYQYIDGEKIIITLCNRNKQPYAIVEFM